MSLNGSDSLTPPTSVAGAAELSDVLYRTLVESISDYAIFLLDAAGHVMSWNSGAERIKGYAAEEIIGQHFSRFYLEEAVNRGWPEEELRQAALSGRFEDEGWRVRKDGSRFWANVVITALRDPEGKLFAYAKITRDLTERRQHEERLRRSEERFRLLLEGVEDYAVVMLDPSGRVSSWNAGAERILGYRAPEVMGQPFERFYPSDDVMAGHPSKELRDALVYRRSQERSWRIRKDGSRFWSDSIITSLRDSEGSLRGYALVMRDMSERKRMEALEEEGRHVTEFLAMLAHELRNPLAPIRNALGILAVSRETSPQVAWCREVIERQTMHLSSLVDDLLDVSRVTRGKLQMNGAPMDLNAAVRRAIESTRPIMEKRRHHLEVKIPGEAIPVTGDMTRLTQVMLNLLNNAAKYTPEGGHVSVEVRADGDDCLVIVKDDGLGIPPQLLERVFDLFAQGERTLDRAEGGLGIGLTLARRIIALHGGTISAQSEGAGKGSTFTVRLPRLNLALDENVAAGSPELPRAMQKRSILVVDDNVDSASSIAMFLRMLGHEVDVKHDGPSALEQIARSTPQVVLLDIGLPGIDGYEVAARVRATPSGQGIKLFAMTGYGQEEDKRRALAAGFDAHLVKPVAPNDLVKLINEVTTGEP